MRVFFLVATFALFLLSHAAQADVVAPKALAVCVACHGESGESVDASYPNLGGQYATYMAIALKAYRSGERQNPLMNGVAAQLSDEDIAALANWYEAQPLHISANGDPADVETGRYLAGYCMGCHGMKGQPVAREFPVIAGQSAPYIAAQLANYKSDARQHPLMKVIARRLSPEDMTALAAFFSQLDPSIH